jgi:uncharacterized membrane protein YfcA
MVPAAPAACVGAVLGAMMLPYALRALLSQALPFVLVGVALYFAFGPILGDAASRQRLSPALYASRLAPAIGFYDGVFGPGADSFYMIGLVVLIGLGIIPALAGARSSNFGSNFGALVVHAMSGHIVAAAGLAMGAGALIGARLGARTALKAGAWLVRLLIVVVSCAMALRLMAAPGGPLAFIWK